MACERLAVYGLGPQTRELLADEGFNGRVACLLDGWEESGSFCGKPIVPLKALTEWGVDTVVIAARPASQRIILKRIRGYCAEHRIAVTDARGNDLTGEESLTVALPEIVPKEALQQQIDEHDVISFDLFDTLLMRRVPAPFDVFRAVEEHLRGTPLAEKLSFSDERQRAELYLSRDASPNLDAIYRHIQRSRGFSEEETRTLRELEQKTERELLLPRREVCALLNGALERGKRVYIVSDSYYSSAELKELLDAFDIKGYEGLYSSCDFGTGKRGELFDRLIEAAGEGTRILHIGDDEEADVRAARRAGLDAARLPSAYDLFSASGLEALLPEAAGYCARLKLGMLAAALFNSPFSAQNGGRRVCSPEELAAFFAPLAADLTLWLRRKAEENKADILLLCARDGYLFRDLLEELREAAPRSAYFLTSRLAVLFACLKTPEDVSAAAAVPFQGSFAEMLATRFLLNGESAAPDTGDIGDYTERILKEAQMRRNGYLRYLRGLKPERKRLAIFDLISAGTTQLATERLTGRKLTGLYLMKTKDGDPDKAALSNESMIDADSETGKALAEESFLLETILTSPEPSFLGFDENGAPEYQRECRTEEELRFVVETQSAIRSYFRSYLALAGRESAETPELDVAILKLLHTVGPDDGVYRNMRWDDAYYRRTISVDDLL